MTTEGFPDDEVTPVEGFAAVEEAFRARIATLPKLEQLRAMTLLSNWIRLETEGRAVICWNAHHMASLTSRQRLPHQPY